MKYDVNSTNIYTLVACELTDILLNEKNVSFRRQVLEAFSEIIEILFIFPGGRRKSSSGVSRRPGQPAQTTDRSEIGSRLFIKPSETDEFIKSRLFFIDRTFK